MCTSASELVTACACRVVHRGSRNAKLEAAVLLNPEVAKAVSCNAGGAGGSGGGGAGSGGCGGGGSAASHSDTRRIQANIDAIMVALVAAAEQLLPRAFVPLQWSIVNAWPMSPTGKMDRYDTIPPAFGSMPSLSHRHLVPCHHYPTDIWFLAITIPPAFLHPKRTWWLPHPCG